MRPRGEIDGKAWAFKDRDLTGSPAQLCYPQVLGGQCASSWLMINSHISILEEPSKKAVICIIKHLSITFDHTHGPLMLDAEMHGQWYQLVGLS